MWSRPWPLAQALAQAAGDWDLPSPRGRVPGGVPAWGQPGNAARAFLEELVGKIRSDVSLWAQGMESLGPFGGCHPWVKGQPALLWPWVLAVPSTTWAVVNEASATAVPRYLSLSLPCRPFRSCER